MFLGGGLEPLLLLKLNVLLQKNRVIGQQYERHRLRNVHTCLTTFDLTESAVQRTQHLAPAATFLSTATEGSAPWGGSVIWMWLEESDMTERLPFHFSLSCIGEGNGSPLQCSCLENPRDGGAWWACIYGVAQSRT